jgi:hypothetical protein
VAYTQAQLDAFWTRYVTMKPVDVLTVSNAEPDFAGMLSYVQRNSLFGFQDYVGPIAGNTKFIGRFGGG